MESLRDACVDESPGCRLDSGPRRCLRCPGGGVRGDAPVAWRPRQDRDQRRNARVQGRRADRRNRAEGLRYARLHPGAERLQQQLPRRFGARHRQGLPRHRRPARRCRHLLGADGFELAVPDGQCRHGLLPDRTRSEQRPGGGRAAVECRRHHQRHVVFLDHRHRRAGTGPRTRRQVPDRRPRL